MEKMNFFDPFYVPVEYKNFPHFAVEMIALLRDVKKLVLLDSSNFDTNFQEFKKFCNKNNLYVGVSGKIRRKKVCFIYIAKSKDLVKKAKKYHFTKDTKNSKDYNLKFYKLLAYPQCCVENFFKVTKNKNTDSPIELLHLREQKSSSKIGCNFHINPFLWKYTNSYLISHIPCSLRCKSSIKYAKEVLGAISEEDEIFSKKLEYTLKCPVLYWEIEEGEEQHKTGHITFENQRGIIFNGAFKNNELIYSDILPLGEIQNDILKKFKSGDSIKKTKDKILISKNRKVINIIYLNKNMDFKPYLIQFKN